MNNNPYLGRIAHAGFYLTVVLIIFVAVLAVNAIKANRYIGSDAFPQSTVTVNGEGEAFAIPDIATFSFTIEKRANTFAEAQSEAAKLANRAIDYLDDQDVEEEDIKTTFYNGSPRYEFRQERIVCVTFPCPQPPGRQVLIGYEVRQGISVKVRDTEDAGKLLSGLGELGIENVSGIDFAIDDEDAVRREARAAAITDAEEKAKQLAKDLDVKLVRVVSFNESEPGHFADDRAFALEGFGGEVAVSAPAPQLPVGENRFTSSVFITYEIR